MTSPLETFASFDGVEIAYAIYGAGPDVLLLHGLRPTTWATGSGRGSSLRWSRVDGASSRTTRAVTARRANRTRLTPTSTTPWCATRRRSLDRLAVTAVDVVGYSMGAIVSSRLVPHEPRARSLVLGGVGGRLARGTVARTAGAHGGRGRGAGREPGCASGRPRFRRFAERNRNDLAAFGRSATRRGGRNTR